MSFELLLSTISRNISLTKEETEIFTALLQHRTIPSGDFLLREGEICRYESFINKGCLKTYYTDQDGAEHITDFLIEDWWADDLYSFLTGTASRSTIKAIEDTELWQISKNNLEKLYQRVPKFERFFRLLFQRAFISQKEQIHSILSFPAEQRYALLLKNKPYAEARFSQKDIASYLGLTPQFLSKLKNKRKRVTP